MKLFKYGVAVGLGYLLGRPDGRERLTQWGRQAADLSRQPEVVRLRERGKDVVTERAQAVKQKVVARSTSSDGSGASDSPTGAAVASSDTGLPAARHRRRLRAPAWRPSLSRTRNAHFPPPTDSAPPTTLGGTTVMEDSEAAMSGVPVVPRQESPTPPADRS